MAARLHDFEGSEMVWISTHDQVSESTVLTAPIWKSTAGERTRFVEEVIARAQICRLRLLGLFADQHFSRSVDSQVSNGVLTFSDVRTPRLYFLTSKYGDRKAVAIGRQNRKNDDRWLALDCSQNVSGSAPPHPWEVSGASVWILRQLWLLAGHVWTGYDRDRTWRGRRARP